MEDTHITNFSSSIAQQNLFDFAHLAKSGFAGYWHIIPFDELEI